MCAGSYSHNADEFSVEKDSGSHVGSPCKLKEFVLRAQKPLLWFVS